MHALYSSVQAQALHQQVQQLEQRMQDGADARITALETVMANLRGTVSDVTAMAQGVMQENQVLTTEVRQLATEREEHAQNNSKLQVSRQCTAVECSITCMRGA